VDQRPGAGAGLQEWAASHANGGYQCRLLADQAALATRQYYRGLARGARQNGASATPCLCRHATPPSRRQRQVGSHTVPRHFVCRLPDTLDDSRTTLPTPSRAGSIGHKEKTDVNRTRLRAKFNTAVIHAFLRTAAVPRLCRITLAPSWRSDAESSTELSGEGGSAAARPQLRRSNLRRIFAFVWTSG
jgi:hypothetical protein